jgi:hypothetical protein
MADDVGRVELQRREKFRHRSRATARTRQREEVPTTEQNGNRAVEIFKPEERGEEERPRGKRGEALY